MTAAMVAGFLTAAAVVGAALVVDGTGTILDGGRARRRARGLRPAPGPAGGTGWVSPRSPLSLPIAGWARLRASAVRAVGGAGREGRRADRDLPVMLDQVTRQLRSGASLPVAVEVAARGRPAVGSDELASDLAAGTPLVPAVEAWLQARPTPARGLAAAALTLASESGGSVAVVLDGVTDTLRDRVALEREVAALSSQARASAAVLVVAPMAFAGLAAAADPRVAQTLFGSPLGWACLVAGAVLDGVGALWMARLVGRSR